MNHLHDHNYVLLLPNLPEEIIEDVDVDVDEEVNIQEHATTYTIIPGVRLKSQIFVDNLNYRYYKSRSRNNKIYVVCENQKNRTAFCPATAYVNTIFKSFPMVYALTSRMTQATYESFLRIVREVLPLNYAQLTIISDYERGLINAVESTFPESRFQGCWFHYCQAIVRYCRRSLNSIYHLFQSNPEAATILRMILALPHLPAQVHPNCTFTIHDGFGVIVEFASQYPNIYQQMEVFLNGYIQEFWLTQIGAASISVYGSDIRTNNYLESFHAMLLNQMGKHPNIWDFLQKLLLIENQFYVEMDQVRRNLTVRNHTSRVQRSDATRRVREYIDTLNYDGNLLMFLQRAGHMMDGYLHGQVGPQP